MGQLSLLSATREARIPQWEALEVQERNLHATTREDPAHHNKDSAQSKVQRKQNSENDIKVLKR